jgi:hypothetical protein
MLLNSNLIRQGGTYVLLCCWLLMGLLACTHAPSRQKTDHPALHRFNVLMGVEYVAVYDASVASFHRFLALNYPQGEDLRGQTALFLEDFFWNPQLSADWQFDPLADSLVLLQLEASGLRKEMYLQDDEIESHSPRYNLYKYLYQQEPDLEEPDTVSYEGVEELIIPKPEVDSLFMAEMRLQDSIMAEMRLRSFRNYGFNPSGKYIFALAGAIYGSGAPVDSAVLEYIIARERIGDISPVVVVDGLKATFSEYRFDDPLLHRILVMEIYYDILRWRFTPLK